MIEVYAGEGASPEPVYFFFIAVVFIIMVILGKYLNKSVEEIKAAYGNSRSYIKREFLMGSCRCLVLRVSYRFTNFQENLGLS